MQRPNSDCAARAVDSHLTLLSAFLPPHEMIWSDADCFGIYPPVIMTQAQYEEIVTCTTDWPGGHPSHLPADDELQAVSALINNELSELDAVDLELKRLEKIYKFVKNERRQLAKQIYAYHVYISPIRRIPDDIVEEIMIRCLPTDAPPSHINKHVAPVLLTHICSRWRRIALSTPRLWSSLQISFRLNGPKSDENPWTEPTRWTYMRRFTLRDVRSPKVDKNLISIWEDDANAMRHWLSLTGACPLTISFGYIPRVVQPIPCIDDLFQFLSTTIPRWSRMDLVPGEKDSEIPPEFVSQVKAQQYIMAEPHSCN